MIQRRTQLSVIAVAALAVFAVAAALLLAGGGSAQADTATESVTLASHAGGNPSPQQTAPTHAAPEPCPGEEGNTNTEAAATVDSGHIALFDVWWNDDEGELTNTSCPPTVEHVEEVRKKNKVITPARDDRSPSRINIDETVIHIPNSAKITLTEADYPSDQYRALWDADDKGSPDGVGNRIVWTLPACPPDGSSETVDLCLSFSAALLNDAEWDGKIVYHVDHVHQIDIDKQDPRYVLAYGVATGENKNLWNSSDVSHSKMLVEPGEYHRPVWFFTSRGTYEFQVHITGTPEQKASKLAGRDPISKDISVSSDVREYILHVGAEANLGIGVTAEPALEDGDTTLDPGDDVTITITASNDGPDEATNAKVDVILPEGLTYSSHVAPTGKDYDSATGVWNIGHFANGASAMLTITAEVASDTHGQALTAKATISATEIVEDEYPVPVLDPDPSNDMDTATVTIANSANEDPMFMGTSSVPENSAAGTLVGNPIAVMEPNSGDTLTFSLTGAGAHKFTASAVAGGAQIAVADGANLDYEIKQSYKLTLGVSDGKDADSNADESVDHTIGVLIQVIDVDETDLVANNGDVAGAGITLTANRIRLNVGEWVNLTAAVGDLPEGYVLGAFAWQEARQWSSTETLWHGQVVTGLNPHHSYTLPEPGIRRFSVIGAYSGEGTGSYSSTSNFVEVEWVNPTN